MHSAQLLSSQSQSKVYAEYNLTWLHCHWVQCFRPHELSQRPLRFALRFTETVFHKLWMSPAFLVWDMAPQLSRSDCRSMLSTLHPIIVQPMILGYLSWIWVDLSLSTSTAVLSLLLSFLLSFLPAPGYPAHTDLTSASALVNSFYQILFCLQRFTLCAWCQMF